MNKFGCSISGRGGRPNRMVYSPSQSDKIYVDTKIAELRTVLDKYIKEVNQFITRHTPTEDNHMVTKRYLEETIKLSIEKSFKEMMTIVKADIADGDLISIRKSIAAIQQDLNWVKEECITFDNRFRDLEKAKMGLKSLQVNRSNN